jgi:hypothetical protein
LKYFLPLVWTIFFGALCIIFWVADNLEIGTWNLSYFRIGWTTFFVIGTGFLFFTFMKLMRVEYDGDFFYVTNYFKIFKYPITNVEKITVKNYPVFKIGIIKFKNAGYFGKKVPFLINQTRFEEVLVNFDNIESVTNKV